MTQRMPFLFLVTALFVLGVVSANFRHDTYDIPWLPGAQANVWEVEARIVVDGTGADSEIYLTLPPPQSGYKLVNEASASSGWGFAISQRSSQRKAHWTKRKASGTQVLFYKLDLVSTDDIIKLPAPDGLPAEVIWEEPFDTAAHHILDGIQPITTGATSLTEQFIQLIRIGDQNVNLLVSQYGLAELVSRMVRTAGYPARTVQALLLEDGRRRQSLRSYTQVWDGVEWRLYDPRSGEVVNSDNMLLWQTDATSLLDVTGGRRSRVSFSMNSQTRSGLLLAQEQVGDLALSLYNLPIAEQGMFKLIMLLPIGALVVVFLRVLIGVRTSGTFMPILIALAFIQTELVPGLVSFVIVIAVGLFIRSYLSALNLLLVARIATLVILVIAMISIFSILSYRLGLIQGLTITFFPMIILAWTIERMSIIWEEEGAKEVFIQGGGSLLVAIFAYLLMTIPLIEHLSFNFPELHLVTLALILMIGRYTGYRLLELKRFGVFRD